VTYLLDPIANEALTTTKDVSGSFSLSANISGQRAGKLSTAKISATPSSKHKNALALTARWANAIKLLLS